MPELIDLLVVTRRGRAQPQRRAAARGRADARARSATSCGSCSRSSAWASRPVQALENMVGRCPTPAVEAFVRAMVQGAACSACRRADPAQPRGRDAQAAPGDGRAAGAEGADQDAVPARLHDLPGAVRRHPRPGASSRSSTRSERLMSASDAFPCPSPPPSQSLCPRRLRRSTARRSASSCPPGTLRVVVAAAMVAARRRELRQVRLQRRCAPRRRLLPDARPAGGDRRSAPAAAERDRPAGEPRGRG